MIACTSCWHLQGDRLEDRLYWIDRALEKMHRLGVRAILHCGDLFEFARIGTKEAPAPVIIEGLKRVLSKYRIPVFAAAGNHDQVGGHDCSAVHAMDGFPFFAHMGDVPSFELPIPGFENVGFVAQDWMPQGSNADWGVSLGVRIGNSGKRKVVVFGHADLPEVSGLDRPNSWPQPRSNDFEVMAYTAEVDNVLCFFGHNHGGSVAVPFQGGFFRGVPALARLRWDEASHVDGWYSLDETLTTHHHLLNGPEFIDARDERYDVCDWDNLPRMSRVRVSTNQASKLSHLVRSARGDRGAYVEVMPDAVERERSEASTTSVRMGMTPRNALVAWCEDQGEADVQAWTVLDRLLQDKELPSAGSGGVAAITSIGLRGHVAFPGGIVNHHFSPSGWTCLVGPTGCGKTTLLEATYAALYGSWPSVYRKTLWAPFEEGRGEVGAQVVLTSGKKLDVNRSRTGTTPCLTADLNEHCLTPYSQPTKVQPAIDPLVDDPDLWLRSSFLTQDHSPDLVESPPEERLKAFNRVLGIEDVAYVRTLVTEELKSFGPLERMREGQRVEADQVVSELADMEKELAQYRDKLQTERGLHTAARSQADAAGEAYRRSHLVSEAEHLRSVAESAPSDSVIAEAEDNRQHFQREADQAKVVLEQRQRHERVLQEGLQAEADLKCVGCWPNLLPCRLIDAAKSKKEAGESIGASSLVPLEAYQKQLADVERERDEAWEIAKTLKASRAQADTAKKRLTSLGEVSPDEGPVTSDEFQVLKSAADQLAAEVRRLEQQEAWTEGQMIARKKRLQALQEAIAKADEELAHLPELKLLERAFARDGIQRALVEQGLPGIQKELDELTSREGLTDIRIHLDYAASDPKATPTVLVSIKGGSWTEARPRSGGQRAIVRLLVRLACCLWIARTTGRRGVLILDEPTAGVSEAYADALARLLVSLVGPDRVFQQGLLASHDEGFAQLVGGVKKVAP